MRVKTVSPVVLTLLLQGAAFAQQPPPRDPKVLQGAARTAALEADLLRKALGNPSPGSYAELAAFYCDQAFRGSDLSPQQRDQLIAKGIAAADAALATDPEFASALTSKSQLRRLQADLETDPQRKADLIKEADALQKVPPMDSEFRAALERLRPIRVGGTVRPPRKIKDAPPVYPAEAITDRIQGVVIMETIIDESGKVAAARVLRSIPQLDEPALAAVRQWEFTPTLLNGQPVAMMMTVTVNFTLQ